MRYLIPLVALLAACSNNVLGNVNEAAQSDGDSSSGPSGGDGSTAGGDTSMATGDNGGGTPTGANTDNTGVSSQGASSFLSSLGIATHIGQGIDDPDDAATAMAYAGILNLRDDTNTSKTDDLVRIHQNHGIKVVPIVNGGVMTDGSYMTMAKTLAKAGALLAAEGPNEPNNFAETYDGATSDYHGSFMPIANLQKDLYAAIKADADTKDIPVFHTSEAGGSEPDDVGLQWLTIPTGAGASMPDGTVYADYANTHNYVCGHLNNLQDNQAWNAEDPTLNGDWDGLYVEYHQTWNKGFAGYALTDLPTLPKVTTETGWPTDGDGSISQEQQGRLFMDLYLSAFKQGWSYTFIYMLRDDNGQGIWGLFDTGWNPKKSGTYMHNLTTILADTGSAPAGKINYSIANEPSTTHDVLLRKSDGTFELVVWGEHFTGGTDSVTVELGRSHDTVKLYDPTTGTDATQTLSNVDHVDLDLTDHPMIIELP